MYGWKATRLVGERENLVPAHVQAARLETARVDSWLEGNKARRLENWTAGRPEAGETYITEAERLQGRK